MKIFTFRLGQFVISALIATISFRCILSLCIGLNSWFLSILCSAVYFCCMFLCGWYLGKKDAIDNGIHDIGFRFHTVTYIMCIGMSCSAYYLRLNTEDLRSILITAITWGLILLVHFILFLLEQKKMIKGYAKDEIFE